MQRWECGSVKEWFCPFCISASGALSSAWMEVWRVTVGEKGTALFKAGFTHSSVPIWDTVPSLSPPKHLWLGQILFLPPLEKKCSPHPVSPCMRSVGNQTSRDDSASASPPTSLYLAHLTKFKSDCVCNSPLCMNKAAFLSKMSFIYCRCVMVVCAPPSLVAAIERVVWGLFIYAFQALFSSSFWG